MNVCETCGYAYEETCGNPACIANPSLSPERREAILQARAKNAELRAEREWLARARSSSFGRK